MPRFKPESLSGDQNHLETTGTFYATLVKSNDYTDDTGEWDATLVVFATDKGSIADRVKPNTKWKFRRLAEALGDEAIDAYTQKDADGYSMFDPADFIGKPVEIVVARYEYQGKTGVRVDRVNQTDSFGAGTGAGEAEKTEESAAAKDNGDHQPVSEDDIPF